MRGRGRRAEEPPHHLGAIHFMAGGAEYSGQSEHRVRDGVPSPHYGHQVGGIDLLLIYHALHQCAQESHVVDIFPVGSVISTGAAIIPMALEAIGIDHDKTMATSEHVKTETGGTAHTLTGALPVVICQSKSRLNPWCMDTKIAGRFTGYWESL